MEYSDMVPVRVYVVDNSKSYIQYLYDELEIQTDIEILGFTDRPEDVLHVCTNNDPHIIILGQIQDDMLSLVNTIHTRYPHICIISVSDRLDVQHARQHLRAGVSGYLLRSDTSPNLAASILTAFQGQAIISSEVTRALL